MKKGLLIFSLIISNILFSQTNFDNINSTQDLIKIQKSVAEKDKHQFYIQFLKVKLFEDIKKTFVSKKYPDEVLIKFSDSILSSYKADDNALNPYEEEKILSFEDFGKKEKGNEAYSKNSDSLMYSMLKVKPSKEDSLKIKNIMSVMTSSMAISKKTGNLKTDYEDYVLQVKTRNEENAFSPKNRNLVLKQLDDLFSNNQYFSDEAHHLLEVNLNPDDFENNLPIPVAKDSVEFQIIEIVPNEILSFGKSYGMSGKVYSNYYRIVNNDVFPFSPFPFDQEGNVPQDFENKIAKYVGNNAGFDGVNDVTIAKDKTKGYIITTYLYKSEDESYFQIQYSTLDFKKFTPLKIRKNDEKSKWKIIM